MASRLITTTTFPRVFFSTPVIFKTTYKLFGSQGYSDDKTDLIFPAFSSRFVDFAVQFCFRCKFSFNEERRSSQVWQWRDFSRPITIFCYASNQWNCFILNRKITSNGFFSCQGGAKGRLSRYVEIFWNKKGFSLLYKTNRFHVAVRLIQ